MQLIHPSFISLNKTPIGILLIQSLFCTDSNKTECVCSAPYWWMVILIRSDEYHSQVTVNGPIWCYQSHINTSLFYSKQINQAPIKGLMLWTAKSWQIPPSSFWLQIALSPWVNVRYMQMAIRSWRRWWQDGKLCTSLWSSELDVL